MSTLGANTIRVYHVDPDANHDDCMSAFASHNIYLFLDLDTFTTQFEQMTPYWNQTQMKAFSAVLDSFQSYSNLAGVFVANEALTFLNKSDVAPYIKASIRDMKTYRDLKNYRAIPVGYAGQYLLFSSSEVSDLLSYRTFDGIGWRYWLAIGPRVYNTQHFHRHRLTKLCYLGADITELRPMLQNYLACPSVASTANPHDTVTADFFALNVYEWCGHSSFQTSGYSDLIKNSTNVQIPIFISETGCREPRPRLFTDQNSVLGDDMSDSWSGAIVYEWIQEANDYGLISYGALVDANDEEALDGYPRKGEEFPRQAHVTGSFRDISHA